MLGRSVRRGVSRQQCNGQKHHVTRSDHLVMVATLCTCPLRLITITMPKQMTDTRAGLDLTPYGHQSTMDEGTANLILPLLDPSFRGELTLSPTKRDTDDSSVPRRLHRGVPRQHEGRAPAHGRKRGEAVGAERGAPGTDVHVVRQRRHRIVTCTRWSRESTK